MPDNWQEVRLKEIVFSRKGKKPNQLYQEPVADSVPYIDIRAFEKGEIRRYGDRKSSNIAGENEVLVVWDGARSGLVGMGKKGAIGSTIMALTPILIEPKYLFRFLQTQFELINSNPRGTGIPHVEPKLFWNIDIPLPPLNEQSRIVEKLDKLLAKVESAKARLERVPLILKRFRQAVLGAAVSGELTKDWRERNPYAKNANIQIKEASFSLAVPEQDLTKLPETWSWVALGNYARCFRGRFSPRPRNDPRYFNGKHPFIQIGNLPREGGFVTSHTQTLNDQGLAVSRNFHKGTVVIAIVGATIGNTGILAYDMCVTDSLVGMDTGTSEGNRYIELFMRQKKHDIRQSSYSSGGQPNIKLGFLNPYPLALPPLEEQKEIVKRVEALFKIADQVEARYEKAKAHVDKLSQSILAKAFRGELVPQDPNDEPAEVLLERIRGNNAK